MRFSIAALAATFTCIQAFSDTSPFLLFSSSPLPESLRDVSRAQLQSRSTVLEAAKSFLKSCPSDIYYILTQPSLSGAELRDHQPHLRAALSNPGVETRFTVSEVLDLAVEDGDMLVEFLRKECGAKTTKRFDVREVVAESVDGKGKGSVVVRGEFPAIGQIRHERAVEIEDTDSSLYSSLYHDLPKGYSYTFIYITTPPKDVVIDENMENQLAYEAYFEEPMHMDLKRDVYPRGKNDTRPPSDRRPLFEKYSFLSPGLFMGILVTILLLSILYVSISAISGLEVSYGAFDKEMGPAAHKKQQ